MAGKYSAYTERRKRKKYELEMAVTAQGTPKGFYKKTPEQIEAGERSLKMRPRVGGYWRRYNDT